MVAKRVLVIEDDADAAGVLEAYLRRENYEVTLASDGLAGLELAQRCKPVQRDYLSRVAAGAGAAGGLAGTLPRERAGLCKSADAGASAGGADWWLAADPGSEPDRWGAGADDPLTG